MTRSVWTVVLVLCVGAVAQTTEPVLMYDFEEGAGAVAKCRADTPIHLVASGTPHWTAGVDGWGVETSPGSILVASKVLSGDDQEALTVQAWVKVTGPGSSHKGKPDNLAAVASNRSQATGFMLAVSAEAPYKAVFVVNGLRPGGHIIYSTQTFETNEWVQLTGVFGGNFLAVYVNGQETRRDIDPAKIAAGARPIAVGGENPSTDYYQLSGVIDRVRVHLRALSTEDVREEASFEPQTPKPPQVSADGTPMRRPMQPAPGADSQRLVTVATRPPADFVGSTDEVLRDAIADVASTGGGTILIAPGEYSLSRTIALNSVRDIALIGSEGTILKFADQVHTRVTEGAKKGDTRIALASTEGLRPGDRLEVQATGRVDGFSGRQTQYFMGTVATVDADGVQLTGPLAYEAPAGTTVVRVHNGISIHGNCDNLTFENLILDGNRQEADVRPINHVVHCGIFGGGPYNKESASERRPTNVRVLHCTIRGFHHRGIAWYSFADSLVAGCTIENTGAEGIDFDHYAIRCAAVDNAIRDCGVGVELNDTSDCLVSGNTVERCGTGLHLWRWYAPEDLNRRNVITGNRFVDSANAGIALGDRTEANQIRRNEVAGSAKAGIILGGVRNCATGNRVTDSGAAGIDVTGRLNLVAGNACRGNAGQAQIEIQGEGNIVSDALAGE